ncbi:MAG: hypothetical protein P1U36_06135 [Legionellaceae bacterium]|nr:hypothetical protein [Legionellaceae bacterium]
MFKREQRKNLILGVMCFMMCGALYAGKLTFVVANSSEKPVIFDVTTDLKIGPVAPGDSYQLSDADYESIAGTQITPTMYSPDNPGMVYSCDSFRVEEPSAYIATLGLNHYKCTSLHAAPVTL